MKKTLYVFFYATLFSILGTLVFSCIWMHDHGKIMTANPNLKAEWIILGILGIFIYWCYAGVFFMLIAMMRGMELEKKFSNIFILTIIGLVGVLPTVVIALYLLSQTPDPFKQYEPMPDRRELIEPYHPELK